MHANDHGSGREPIAVVGMSGRFPDAPTTDTLWDLLEAGDESVGPAPADRPWMRDLYSPEPRTPGRIPTNRGGFLSGIDLFDAGFFDISPREAARTDPQLRILLETAHEAIEDAGIPGERLARDPAGVFVGGCYSDYWLRHIADPAALDFYTEIGSSARSQLSGRLAYAFDLRGPALTVDTACSSSLMAVHLACQSLWAGECDTALAGGVNIILTPYTSLTFAWAGGLSPQGRCKFADASADGFVRSEAAGLVLLKPLDRALADGDRVRAVIRGSAATNNGFTGLGVAAPARTGQAQALRRAWQDAGADPARAAFIEAHGTGTPLGDRTELEALGDVLGERRVGSPVPVMSGKANLGHTESAAGIAGLIKAVLSLERRRVPGHPHPLTPTPAVDWEQAPFWVPQEPVDLPAEGELLAGVSSLGASGTNVHTVLASAPPGPRPAGDSGGPYLLTLSARSPQALRELAAAHRALLTGDRAPEPAELCAAAGRRRTHQDWRAAVTGDSREELAAALVDVAEAGRGGGSPSVRPRVVFVFPGQGAQWPGMGRELLDHSAAFRSTLTRCDEIIRMETGWSLLDALRGEDTSWQERTSRIQPALWAMGAALADHWRSWGIVPDAVLGQSQGEIAAAYCAGALTLEQAGRLSCRRALLIEELAPPGAMAWLALPHAEATDFLAASRIDAQVAVAESAASCVVSGSPDQIDRLLDAGADQGLECRAVPVAYAAHSAQIDAVRGPLLEQLADLKPGADQVPFWSTVTGGPLAGTELDADYWWRNLREPVLLEPVVGTCGGDEPVVFVQMSPHPVLTGALQRGARDHVRVVASLRRAEPELATMLGSLGQLYEAGIDADWAALYPAGGRSVRLPPYPWQREHYWYQAEDYPYPPVGELSADEAPVPAATGTQPAAAGQVWDFDRDRYLLDHRVAGQSVMPGAAFLNALFDFVGPAGELNEVVFHEMLPLDPSDPPEERVRTEISEQAEGEHGIRRLVLESRTGATWTCHATAETSAERVAPNATEKPAEHPVGQVHEQTADSPDSIRARCTIHLNAAEFYGRYSGDRNTWQGAFRGVEELWHGPGEALARVIVRTSEGRPLHPAVLDACMQPVAALLDPGSGFVLTGVRHIRAQRDLLASELWSHVRVKDDGSGVHYAEVTVRDAEGRIAVLMTGLQAKSLFPAHARAGEGPPRGQASSARVAYGEWNHAVRWEPIRLPAPATESGNYLLLGHGGRLDRRLTRELTQAGHTVTAAPLTACLTDLLAETAEDGPLDAVICLYVDEDAATHNAAEDVQEEAVRLCASLTDTVRALTDAPCRLLLVTQGTQQAREEDGCPAVRHAALWGLGLVTGHEHPELRLLLADLAEGGEARDDAAHLARLLLSDTPEPRVALREGTYLAPRLAVAGEGGGRPSLALVTDGGLDGLALRAAGRVEPGPGEIQIEVTHAGLNYHDVLAAAGADGAAGEGPPPLGCECAGTVIRTGPEVDDFAVGDAVIAFAHPCLRTHLTVPAHLAAHAPVALSAAEAAALPAAHATAYHALVERARLAPGERVLIHSATGGVGLAAISVARMCGATVYATAGTPAKRQLLERLGVEKVADSRTTDFAEQFSDGVDVVLGTLVGEGLKAGFSVLNPFGRYVDLAINDIAAGRPLEMNVFARSHSYLPVNLLDLYRHRPRHLSHLVRTVAHLVDTGELEPPTTRVFPADEAADAFTLMARGGHTGKITLAMPRDSIEPAAVRPSATYLITGGASGVGALLAQWLADQGATHLLLTGRSDLTSITDEDPRAVQLRRLREDGCDVEYAAIDAADQEALAELLRRREREGRPPVAGVAHAAAVLTPTPVTDLSDHELDTTLHPKVAGGWALHQFFADEQQPLDFFVLFSSAVSVLGGLTVGHHLGAYAAANAFADALAAHRRAQGLPATVVNFGYWSEVGIAARLSQANGHDVCPQGMEPIRPADAPALFSRMLSEPGRHLLFAPTNWDRYFTSYPSDTGNPLLSTLAGALAEDSGQGAVARRPGMTTAPRPRDHAAPSRSGINASANGGRPSGTESPPPGPAERVGEPDGNQQLPDTGNQLRPGTRRTPDVMDEPTPPRRPALAKTPPTRNASNGRRTPPVPPPAPHPGNPTAAQPLPPANGVRADQTPPAPRGESHRSRHVTASAGEASVPTACDPKALEERLTTHLAAILGSEPHQIDRRRPMNRLGMDSLMATELRTRLRRDHNLDVPVARLLGSDSIKALAVDLARQDQS